MGGEHMMAKSRAPVGPGKLGKLFFVWPVKLSWRVSSMVEKRLGIVPTLLLGGFLTMVGMAFSSSLIGIIFGIPLAAAGLFLLVRALY